jgi:hypothetical protein
MKNFTGTFFVRIWRLDQLDAIGALGGARGATRPTSMLL